MCDHLSQRLPIISPPSLFAPVTQPPILERAILHLKSACLVYGLKNEEYCSLKRACFGLWLIERGILHLKCAK